MIMAGGTGGHVFPALAVAEALKQRAAEVFWMGTAQGIEARLVPQSGFELSEIKVQGLRGKGLLGWLLAPFRLVKAVWEAWRVMRRIDPDVVLGLGGFASGPGGVAAWLMRKPLVIHEQNAIPGLTNRLLAKLAKLTLEGFPNSFKEAANAQWVGNPVRKSIEVLPAPELRFDKREGAIHLLVLGGSLGARSLNTVVPQAMALIDSGQRPRVIHQCGSRHLNDCRENYQRAGVQAKVTDFIGDMAEAYGWADLVICRAGALTVAELAAAGVGALLVPYPYAVDDHQTHNATMLVEAGAAQLIADSALEPESVAEQISRFSADREALLNMANAACTVARTGTAEQIADKCLELAHG
jgi:UDP-N-acetylglucosamine--N-acetylmuramyl-(pentapeptide) pyrophosphoryl-undecaprenol N-acetylglucosamine transferase